MNIIIQIDLENMVNNIWETFYYLRWSLRIRTERVIECYISIIYSPRKAADHILPGDLESG